MKVYIFQKTESSIEDLILANQHIFIYIPISIECPFYLVKTKMSHKEIKIFFSENQPLFFDSKLIENNSLHIEDWNSEIKKTLLDNKNLDPTNFDDIDEIFSLISEFGLDFLNFEQREVIEEYSKTF